ncbi:3-oxoacyl-[acyl-carrier-protein] synthase II [Peptoniphilus asaccharolyticus DSM 20463]|uniref:3-oxoacyl-[acyl-carrier-protein] synthase 2 n=1 Tax=Peptoniphilus asaccharolyticus DSM 20463 TaxID=573058 RepID=A0A1W1UX05_PEPAS|nr:beta-ketoacyl-ACP synthase II [Peptoniphilus asaccharolyticus]MBL7575304.1 beta-ketoacyl-ACP synthase II [Peptoniphilus asaccharolyticus]SMB85678.1 3-oxoacyl-[acyl-carrier-protein] synthase II [Peptoniphilus asaccharolyticus DSM 20463]
MRRVVVTGIGIVCPIGNDRDSVVENIKNKICSIDKITHYDTIEREVKLASELKDFNVDEHFDKREQKRLDRVNQLGIVAARRALKDSNLTIEEVEKMNVGVYVASGIGGLGTIEKEHERGMKRGFDKVSPYFIPMAISNLTASNIAMDIHAHGSCQCHVTACASSTNAIGEAFRDIKHGYEDIIFAGGSEASITELGIGGFTSMKALCTSEDPTRASIPFDKDRSGFVMGEGAAILVLEELEHAKSRNANILAEIVGYSTNCDAYHITSPSPNGEYAAKAMAAAIKEAGIKESEVDYINAHGTSTELNDKYETAAIKKVFGADTDVLVSSTKSQIGHLLGASGAVETSISIFSMNENILPPLVNYKNLDEDCDLNFVTDVKEYKANYILKNSLGFGGHNATLIVKRY